MISSLIRKAIKKMLLEKVKDIKVKKEDVESYLGKPIFLYNQIDLHDQVGVVTGLAFFHPIPGLKLICPLKGCYIAISYLPFHHTF